MGAQERLDAKEKEMVAYQLVKLVGRAGAANILGITVRDLDKLVEVFELSEKFTNLREPGAAIRGVLIAADFDKRARAAARMVPNLSLRRYGIRFSFSEVGT